MTDNPGKQKTCLGYLYIKQDTSNFKIVKRCLWKSTGKKYGKMKCFITSCTRKASNVAFQTLRFERGGGKSTAKWNVL